MTVKVFRGIACRGTELIMGLSVFIRFHPCSSVFQRFSVV